MTVILCVDDRGGLCFAGRRQSQDRYVRKDILALCQTKRLFMDHYSKGQFTEPEGALIEVADDFLDVLGEEDVCFLERQTPQPYLERASTVGIGTIHPLTPSSFHQMGGFRHRKKNFVDIPMKK